MQHVVLSEHGSHHHRPRARWHTRINVDTCRWRDGDTSYPYKREDDRGEWERDVRGDEEELARAFDDFLKWFDAKMPGVDIDDEDSLRMLEELVFEARRQGPGGYIDDLIAGAHDWGFAVEDIRVPTRIMAAQDDSPFMHENSRWLADHIPGAELLWRAGGHVNPKDDAESRLFGWLGYGVDPTPA